LLGLPILPRGSLPIERHQRALQGLALAGRALRAPSGAQGLLQLTSGLGGSRELGGGLGSPLGDALVQPIGGLPIGGVEAALGYFLGEPAQLLLHGDTERLLLGERLGLGLDGSDLGGGGGVDGTRGGGGQRQE